MTKNTITISKTSRENIERSICKELAHKLNGSLEAFNIFGRIDILTNDSIIEVKDACSWKHALGQIICYSHDKSFSHLQKKVYLFNHSIYNYQQKLSIRSVMEANDIHVVFYNSSKDKNHLAKVKIEQNHIVKGPYNGRVLRPDTIRKRLILKKKAEKIIAINKKKAGEIKLKIPLALGIRDLADTTTEISREKILSLSKSTLLKNITSLISNKSLRSVERKKGLTRVKYILNRFLIEYCQVKLKPGKQKTKRVNRKRFIITPFILTSTLDHTLHDLIEEK